jgi:hypothetical protein
MKTHRKYSSSSRKNLNKPEMNGTLRKIEKKETNIS